MQASPSQERFSQRFLLLLLAAISVTFLLLIQRFIVSLLLAGIFAGMTTPLYRRLLRSRFMRERKTLAAISTIAIVLFVVVIPLAGFLGIVVSQAVNISQAVRPWVEQQLSQPGELDRWLERLPFLEYLQPYQDRIIAKLGEFAGTVGEFVVENVAAFTAGTVSFFLQFFITLYAMFFFLIDGRRILDRILYFMPLGPEEEGLMVDRFVSVTRATLKGTLVIGVVQGGLAGAAFFVAGIAGSAFWGTIMAVLSIIPGLGTALIWGPATIYLLVTGHVVAGLLLAVWCGLVVGTVDNLLRPRLIGRDTKMSDLMILLGTLGGLFLFGAIGFIIGPIVAALFVTVWDIYGAAFKEYLPAIRQVETSS